MERIENMKNRFAITVCFALVISAAPVLVSSAGGAPLGTDFVYQGQHKL